jgi:hypothetical protein
MDTWNNNSGAIALLLSLDSIKVNSVIYFKNTTTYRRSCSENKMCLIFL